MAANPRELVWFNGSVMPLTEARIGLEERGLNFADGVYEVIRFYRGRAFTMAEHLERLARSAKEIQLRLPLSRTQLSREIESLIGRSGIADGMVYLQLTRGEAPRAHVFPEAATPNLYFYCRAVPDPWEPGAGAGCRLISLPDERWLRCHIKSIALLPNVLAKNHAIATGHDEAVFIHEGKVTECSASNIFCVRQGRLYTCPVGSKVLPGITRLVLLKLAKRQAVPVDEVALPLAEALESDEVLITSTTRELNWVRHWDGKTIGQGKCGPVTRKLHEAYVEEVLRETSEDVVAA